MSERDPSTRDWREQAQHLFGTDDPDAIERALAQDGSARTDEELRLRRAVLFRALAARDAQRRSHPDPAAEPAQLD